jgi:hypothetical protein
MVALLVACLLAGCGDTASTEPGSTTGGSDAPAAHEGGDAIPAGATTIEFLWIGKQSVLCIGESFEKQVAFVDFSADGGAMEIGEVSLDTNGNGRARFAVPVATLRTGHEDRDTKLMGGVWLDAETHPEIVFETTKLERVRPTVWHAEGTWTMKGVPQPVSFYANVRYLPEMRNVGKDVVRLKASFDIDLAAHGVGAKYVDSPAVAATWTVQMVLLGTMKRAE